MRVSCSADGKVGVCAGHRCGHRFYVCVELGEVALGHYVVAGCAASGTKWMSQVLTAMGSNCGHQRVFRVLGTRKWRAYEGDSSFFAFGQLPRELPTLRIVRNPLHVVRSLEQMSGFLTRDTTDDELTLNYIEYHAPGVTTPDDPEDRLGRLLRYVARWDADDELPDVTIKVDDTGPTELENVYAFLTGRRSSIPAADIFNATMGQRVNTHGGPRSTLTWEDIEAHPDGAAVIEKAKRYSYL